MSAPDAVDGPVAIAADLGWCDGFTAHPRRDQRGWSAAEQRAYEEQYVFGWQQRDEPLVTAAYHADCDQVHGPGECPLVVLHRPQPLERLWVWLLSLGRRG